MDEAEWLTCTDPRPMLDFLRGRASERSLRLFACACVERCRDWLEDERSRRAVETARRYAGRLASEDELRRDREAARLAWLAAEDATWRVAARQGREFGVCRAAHAAFWAAGDSSSPTLDAAEVALVVAVEAHAPCGVGVSSKAAGLLFGRHVPHLHPLVKAPRGEAPAVGAERHALNDALICSAAPRGRRGRCPPVDGCSRRARPRSG
jgi:hypothetical protein